MGKAIEMEFDMEDELDQCPCQIVLHEIEVAILPWRCMALLGNTRKLVETVEKVDAVN